MGFLGRLFSSFGDSPDDGDDSCNDDSYAEYVCDYCDYAWRVEGNGGLVLGCVPNCPKCGTLPLEWKCSDE